MSTVSSNNSHESGHCGTNAEYPLIISGNKVVSNYNYDSQAAQIPSDCGNNFSRPEKGEVQGETKTLPQKK